jgi:uncharacterized membrane protein
LRDYDVDFFSNAPFYPAASHVVEDKPWQSRTSRYRSFRPISKRPSGLSLSSTPSTTRTPRRFSALSARIITFVGRPQFLGVLTVIVAIWISLNLLASALGYSPIDPPPFSGLVGAVSLASLYMVVLILATQRRENQLAQLREQLNLELAILGEQKTAKIIQLLEESRRDNPLIRNRVDQEAEAMAQPADPQSVLEAIKQTHAEAEQISDGTDGS